jgi:hypothetical protein
MQEYVYISSDESVRFIVYRCWSSVQDCEYCVYCWNVNIQLWNKIIDKWWKQTICQSVHHLVQVEDMRSGALHSFRSGSQLCWISETFHRHIVIQMIPPLVLVCCVTSGYCISEPVNIRTAYLSVCGLHSTRGRRKIHSEEHYNFHKISSMMSRGSSVSIVSDYGLDDRG